MARASLVFALTAASALACGEPPPAPSAPHASATATASAVCTPHTVILVRHAEKASAEGKDPELSPRGTERAQRLAVLLARAGATKLVATEYKRTQLTLAPLAEKTKLTVETAQASQTNDLIARLRAEKPGSVTVVATHSNVIPAMAKALGAPTLRDLGADGYLPESEFGRVIVLTVPCSLDAPSMLLELSSD